MEEEAMSLAFNCGKVIPIELEPQRD